MSKKELRLAVVIYGGASLAIYMHGVTKELLKLVRASKVLHEMGVDNAANGSYADGPDQRPSDTEAVYFELLKQINARSHFRVVLDVIAGASAGAINGVMLAKAIVDDEQLDGQTPTWLTDADVEHMGRDISPWTKWYLYPLVRLLLWLLPADIKADAETRGKFARVIRSSWFRPPLSGARLSHIFLDALERHYGKRPVIYTTPDFYEHNIAGHFRGETFWLRTVKAHPRVTYPGRNWAFWQYTGTGVVPGVAGDTDINAFAGSASEWRDWISKNSI